MTSAQSYMEIAKTPILAGLGGYAISRWAYENVGTATIPLIGQVDTNIATGVITALASLANKLSKNFI